MAGYKGKKYTREQAYDKLYPIACKLLDRMHACSKCPIFVKDTNVHSCGFSKAWCCEGCPHLDPARGCTVEALMCRIHLCAPESDRQWHTHRVLRQRMRRVRNIAHSYRLLLARATRQQALELAETVDPWYIYRTMKHKFTGENI